MATKLGILAGGGALPVKLIERCRSTGRDFFVLAFDGQTDPALVEGVPHAWTRLGAGDAAIRLLRENGVEDLVMAGRIRRPTLAELRPDWRTARLYGRLGVGALGDDGLLQAVRREAESEGFRLVGVHDVMGDLVATAGTYGQHAPDGQAESDIAQGFRTAAALGVLDIGQAVVVQQGIVLGVEALEGTDALIERCGTLRRDGPGGVLVKASKPGQDRRMDMPTVGPETVERAAAAGLRGIAIQAGKSLVMERDLMAATADRLGLFVVGRDLSVEQPLFYLIAGEPSGDAIGASVMRAIRAQTHGAARFAGIGGEQMAAEGLQSLLPIKGLAIMGVLEVLPAARRVFRWIRETIADIDSKKPAAVVTIDSSGFCFRVGERLRARPSHPLVVHYVAPMVWAWRPYRTQNAARAADHLLTLLPFEPAYFEPVGLPSTYVGHPVVESGADRGDGAGFRGRHGIAADAMVLAVLPGSRRSEVNRLLPIFAETVTALAKRFPDLVVIVPTVETVGDVVAEAVGTWPVQTVVVRGKEEKFDAFAASQAALAASGTVTLELAVAGVPMVTAYKVWPITAWMIRRASKTKWATMVNILLDREVVPEHLQERCNPAMLEQEVARLLSDPEASAAQRAACRQALAMIGLGGEPPSTLAARKILELVAAQKAA